MSVEALKKLFPFGFYLPAMKYSLEGFCDPDKWVDMMNKAFDETEESELKTSLGDNE